jgi:hypothetical protein
MAKPKGLTWQAAFLETLERDGYARVSHACKKAGISRVSAYEARNNDPEFAAKWQAVIESATDELEQHAMDVAMGRSEDGNPTMMIFMLKNLRRKTFGENPLDGADAPPSITVSFNGRPNVG